MPSSTRPRLTITSIPNHITQITTRELSDLNYRPTDPFVIVTPKCTVYQHNLLADCLSSKAEAYVLRCGPEHVAT